MKLIKESIDANRRRGATLCSNLTLIVILIINELEFSGKLKLSTYVNFVDTFFLFYETRTYIIFID